MPDPIAALLDGLWEIKNSNGHTFREMADNAGLELVTLWRVMRGERRPNGDTLTAILQAYPHLAGVFLPADSPNVEAPVPNGILEPQ